MLANTYKVNNETVAFVTGASRVGIGQAIVEALVQMGAKTVYATARRLADLDNLVAKHGGKVVPVVLDVTDLTAIKGLSLKFPDVNLLINNAGYVMPSPAVDGDVAAAQLEMQVNYIAPMAITSSFSEVLKKSSSSAVVNINSISSLVNGGAVPTYAASKAAAHSLTQAQRREMPFSLVIGVYPGPIDTDMTKMASHPKESPQTVADAVINSLAKGEEDVFPDVTARKLYEAWRQDPKGLEHFISRKAAMAASH